MITENSKIQESIIDKIRDHLPQHLSLVDEIAGTLAISKDSAYRRINGKTPLSIEEAGHLSSSFGISLDELLHDYSNTVSFEYRQVGNYDSAFKKYLKSVLSNLQTVGQFQEKECIYLAKDLPIFHWFQFEELAAFKIFFWKKTILNLQELEDQTFDFESIPLEIAEICSAIHKQYIQLPSIEIWSEEVINVTLRQIRFYWESGIIQDSYVLRKLYQQLRLVIKHLKKQAEEGCKFHSDEDKGQYFQLFLNEILMCDNTILFRVGDTMITHVTHNLFDILTTKNHIFCQNTFDYIQTLKCKSMPISGVNEKHRNVFFKKILEWIEHSEQTLLRGFSAFDKKNRF